MTGCESHRVFLAAIADGEVGLVPAATIRHVGGCEDCTREVESHRELTARLRQAGELHDRPATRDVQRARGRRRLAIAGIAAATLAVAGVTLSVQWIARPDPVLAAVAASSKPLQIQSTDAGAVGSWCRQSSGRTLPELQLDGMSVLGARMDQVPATDIVTVAYAAASGDRVTVAWLEGQAPGGNGVEAKTISGQQILVVHSSRGAAVVIGASSATMWEAAAAIESA